MLVVAPTGLYSSSPPGGDRALLFEVSLHDEYFCPSISAGVTDVADLEDGFCLRRRGHRPYPLTARDLPEGQVSAPWAHEDFRATSIQFQHTLLRAQGYHPWSRVW